MLLKEKAYLCIDGFAAAISNHFGRTMMCSAFEMPDTGNRRSRDFADLGN